MPLKKHNPAELFPQYGNYSHGVEVSGDSRILFISGLNGYIAIRREFQKGHQPASTVICCQLLETKWKLEIEAVAAR